MSVTIITDEGKFRVVKLNSGMIRWTKPHASGSSYVGIKSCANKGEPWWQRQSMSRYDVYLRKTSSLSNKNVYHVLIIIMQNLWLLARLKPGNHFSSLCENLPWSQQARLFFFGLNLLFSIKEFWTVESKNVRHVRERKYLWYYCSERHEMKIVKLFAGLFVCLFVCLYN